MKISQIIKHLEEFAPPSYQENYDNSGLLVGNPETELSNALICLDSTEAVIDEAIERGCNLVIAHHPIIFSGLKKLNGKNYVERTIIKAIQNNIAIYAIHTNLDNVKAGVNAEIAERLGLINLRILRPKSGDLKKLAVFCPEEQAGNLQFALCEAGAGNIGNYDQCSFSSAGIGTFRGNENTNPFVGKRGEIHNKSEIKIEVVFPSYLQSVILEAMKKNHPYEEIAFDIYSLDNQNTHVGSGMLGELDMEENEMEFLQKVKIHLKTKCIRHTALSGKPIKKVAVCGGSGSFLLKDAIQAKADIFITADFKYHEFFDAENRIVIADVGHYESEQFTKELLRDFLIQKTPTFAPFLTKVDTNPVNYI